MSLRSYQQAVMDHVCGDRENPDNDRRFTIFVPLGAGSVPVTTKRPGRRAVRTEVQPMGTVAPGSNKAVSAASTAHRPLLVGKTPHALIIDEVVAHKLDRQLSAKLRCTGTGWVAHAQPEMQDLPLADPNLRAIRDACKGAADGRATTLARLRNAVTAPPMTHGDFAAIEARLLADYPIYGNRTCLVCGAPESQGCGC